MKTIIEFHAEFHRVTTDDEGQSRVTLTVPQSDYVKVASLAAATKRLLLVTVDVDPDDA